MHYLKHQGYLFVNSGYAVLFAIVQAQGQRGLKSEQSRMGNHFQNAFLIIQRTILTDMDNERCPTVRFRPDNKAYL